MKKHLVIIVLLCIFHIASAQKDSMKLKHYQTWIHFNNNLKTLRGQLNEVKDSSLSVSQFVNSKSYYLNKPIKINYDNIERIQIRRNRNKGRGALIGGLTGAAFGGLIGHYQGDDDSGPHSIGLSFTAKDKAQIGGVMGLLSGAFVGSLFGSIKINIPINGNFDKFQQHRDKLKKYLIKR